MKFIREASICGITESSQGYVNSYMELYNSFNDKPTVTKTINLNSLKILV